MTDETQKINDLMRELVESFIDYPTSLALAAKEVPGSVYWSMQGHADDTPKLIGIRGAHFNALRFLFLRLGRVRDLLYTFKVNEPERAQRRESSPPKVAKAYDPRKAKELLSQILDALLIGQYVVDIKLAHKDKTPLEYTFIIFTRDEADYDDLTVAPQGSIDTMTIVAALGTIFRAYANKDGVKFVIDVRRP